MCYFNKKMKKCLDFQFNFRFNMSFNHEFNFTKISIGYIPKVHNHNPQRIGWGLD